MARMDAVTNQYLKDNIVFADAVNYTLHGGRQVIRPEQLKDLDTALYLAEEAANKAVKHKPDVVKAYTAKEDA